MEEIKATYTNVCTHCETPVNLLKKDSWVRGFIYIIVGAILAIPVLMTAIALWFITIPIAIVYFLFRNDMPKCPSCNHRALVPVDSPAGLDIMTKNGWDAI